jgi:dTDP-glucose 4,6-dehydratase
MKFVVTGGRGFIGSHFVELALQKGHSVIDIDKMTYCANESLPWDNNPNYSLLKKDISELNHIPNCDVLLNFAAESHVDNSINDTKPFMKSNVMGTHNLLELVRGKRDYDRPLFFQISTDEVYGDKDVGEFHEEDRLKPSNPYSASKAAAEMIVLSYSRTYGIDYVITRSTNNYGERQYQEKLIPRIINCLKENRKIPLHGDGSYVRDWIYVKDNVEAIMTIVEARCKNDIYNIGAGNQLSNLEVSKKVMTWFGKENEDMISFVENRWGQDIRYSINCDKLKSLNWRANHSSLYKWF